MSLQDDNASVANALGTLSLNGTTYLVEPATEQDVMTLMEYLRKHAPDPLEAILPGLQKLPPHLQQKAVEAAVRLTAGNAGGRDLTDEGARTLMGRPKHMAFLTWLLLSKRHPALTLAEVEKHLATDADVERVNRELFVAAGIDRLQKKMFGGGEPGPTGPGS